MKQFSLFVCVAACALAAEPDLNGVLQKLARYDYNQGREGLLEFEAIARKLPAKELEPQLITFLSGEGSLAGKDFIVRQLSVMGSSAAVPALAAALRKTETMEMARFALERIPGEVSGEALRKALKDLPESAKLGITNSLGNRRDAKSVSLLQPLIFSTNSALALSAIAALGRIGTPESLAALASSRKNGSLPAMEASLVCAERLAAQGNVAAADRVYAELNQPATPVMVRVAALHGLTNSKQGLAPLAAALNDKDPKVQGAAIRGLKEYKDPAASSLLIRAFPNLPAAIRPHAITALMHRQDPIALPLFVQASADESSTIRAAAYTALSALPAPSSVSVLAKLASDPAKDPADRDAARAALDRMRGKSIDDAIVVALPSADSLLKLELVRSAGERSIRSASPFLLSLLGSTDRSLRREAFKSLRETASAPEVVPLLSLLAGSKPTDRRDFERALSAALRRGDAASSKAVIAAFQSAAQPEMKESLLQVMGQAGGDEMLPLLQTGLRSTNADIVRASILGLSEWPTDTPIEDLLLLTSTTPEPANQILAQRGVIQLVGLATRSVPDSLQLLEAVLKVARMADEKKAILALLPRFANKTAFAMAQSLESDPEVSAEAKAALSRLQRFAPAK